MARAVMLLFTVLTVWTIRRFWYSQRLNDAYWGIACVYLLATNVERVGTRAALSSCSLPAGWRFGALR